VVLLLKPELVKRRRTTSTDRTAWRCVNVKVKRKAVRGLVSEESQKQPILEEPSKLHFYFLFLGTRIANHSLCTVCSDWRMYLAASQ
jgi:hypothetical protein